MGRTARGTEWVALAGACQSLVNTVTAAQDVAVAEAARREGTWCEDGTLGEQVHGRGAVTLDAADVVAPALGVSHNQAQRRVEQAVQLALGRAPVEADRGEVATENGLGGLHTAMADGDLDGYRAGVVAFELEEAPAEVADAVVAALTEHLAEDAPTHAAPGAAVAGAHQPRPAAAARGAGAGVDRPAAVGGRARGRRVVRHVPQRGGRHGVGGRRPARAPVRGRRRVFVGGAGPRSSPDRPRHRQRHGRRAGGAHGPGRAASRPCATPTCPPGSTCRQRRADRARTSSRCRAPARPSRCSCGVPG